MTLAALPTPDLLAIVRRAPLAVDERRIATTLATTFGEWVTNDHLAHIVYGAAPKGGLTAAARLAGACAHMVAALASESLAIESEPARGRRMVWIEQPADAATPAPTPAQARRELREGEIDLGRAASRDPVGLDLAKLIDGRLLIQGNSGAGKSMLLRRLFEQAFGRVQQLLIDPDGEFSTLAEAFDVAVIAAPEIERVGGRALALQLRAHRYSAVLDLSDATAEQRLAAADLAQGLIEAPAEHWRPLLVLIDEAQTFAPHYDTGDVEAETRKRAIAALADMMGRGRKRGVAGVIATQRLAETAKAVVAKATNVVVGRTVFDRDLERAGALLGYTAGHARVLRTLADGEFLCMGPAFGGAHRTRFKAGPVVSRHKSQAPALDTPPAISAAAAAALLGAMPGEAKAQTPAPAQRAVAARVAWTDQEDEVIRRGYAEGRLLADIVEDLAAGGRHVGESYVSARARKLGAVHAHRISGWTEEEDAIIRDAYAREVRIIDIVALLKESGYERGRVAVQMRAIALGITRDRVNYWTEAEKKIAIAGLEAGKTHGEVIADLRAAGYERGVTAIHKFAQRHGYDRKVEAWTHDEIAVLTELYETKSPVKAIAERLGKSIGAIRTKASNLNLKQRVPWSEEEYELLRAAQADGKTLGWAAERIGRPYPNVARVAADIGLRFQTKAPR